MSNNTSVNEDRSKNERNYTVNKESSRKTSVNRSKIVKNTTTEKHVKKRSSKNPKKTVKAKENIKSAKKEYKKNKEKSRNISQLNNSKKTPKSRGNSKLNKQTKKAVPFPTLMNQEKLKKILEVKIMKYLSQNKVFDTNLEFYNLTKLLGEGSYAKVHLGASVLCRKKVAIKLYDKAKIKSKTSSQRIFTEIGILRRMNHKNIVNFIEIFQNQKYIFIVLEYANGGDLLNYLKEKGVFKESEFRNILQQIIDGLEYIHEHKILHRDIKLDNILLTKSGRVKICDFGISRKMVRNDLVFEHIGTPAYIAPEIIKEKGYSGFNADIWSLGVMTYMALTGNVPFKGATIEELHQSILEKELNFPEKINLSSEMKQAIEGMLIKNPKKRISLKEVCNILDLRMTLNQRPERIYADEGIVNSIKSFGYPEHMIRDSLKNDVINHITALYKLLKS